MCECYYNDLTPLTPILRKCDVFVSLHIYEYFSKLSAYRPETGVICYRAICSGPVSCDI